MNLKETETRLEAETIIRFDETGGPARVYTASKRVADKLLGAGLKPKKTDRFRDEEACWFFEVDPGAVLLKPGATQIRLGIRRQEVDAELLTDDEKRRRAEGTERLRVAREHQKAKRESELSPSKPQQADSVKAQ